jgi:hypothetical protein
LKRLDTGILTLPGRPIGEAPMLAGDLIMRALRRRDPSAPLDLDAAPLSVAEFDQGGTDPGNIAAFLAFDIPFDVEPTTGLIFPTDVPRD